MTTRTLQEALDITYRDNWQHRRDKGACLMSQAKAAIKTIEAYSPLTLFPIIGGKPGYTSLKVSDVTARDVRDATSMWYADGLSPATITKRLNCLSVLGVCVEGLRPPEKTALKWWLRPEEEERAVVWLMTRRGGLRDIPAWLASFIRWTTKTGLRVEETLRLEWGHIDGTSVMVPGLKTASSQATLPLSTAAIKVLDNLPGGPTGQVFPMTYKELMEAWAFLRADMGWPPEATLKALRRSAARYLHVDCNMPLDMVRQYLRHENIETTMGYLRLTGGYGTEEMRRYLK